jgi:hypothetical protein
VRRNRQFCDFASSKLLTEGGFFQKLPPQSRRFSCLVGTLEETLTVLERWAFLARKVAAGFSARALARKCVFAPLLDVAEPRQQRRPVLLAVDRRRVRDRRWRRLGRVIEFFGGIDQQTITLSYNTLSW